MAASILGALLPTLIERTVAPMYAASSAELPALTQAWLRGYWLAWLLPLVVLGAWWGLRTHSQRDRIAFLVGLVGAVAVDAVSIIAAWLPLLGLPGLATGAPA